MGSVLPPPPGASGSSFHSQPPYRRSATGRRAWQVEGEAENADPLQGLNGGSGHGLLFPLCFESLTLPLMRRYFALAYAFYGLRLHASFQPQYAIFWVVFASLVPL